MIRVGIIGTNYGLQVHLPAFRADARCHVTAMCGSNRERAATRAKEAGIGLSFDDWNCLVEHPDVDAVTIAVPPSLQPRIALRALELGKPVFAEKPMAASLAEAREMAELAISRALPAMVDFNFSGIFAWRQAKSLLDQGAIGRLRHVSVNWNVENYSTKMRMRNWKTLGGEGGGALGNFVSHCFHYLEWFCGPISGLSALLSGLPYAPDIETNASISLAFENGAAGTIAMSCASYLGSGHRVEFYGEDGALTLINPTPDYMRGFELRWGRRPAALAEVEVEDAADRRYPQDGRIAPVSRLATDFLSAIDGRNAAVPGFAEGLRVQLLLDAARRANNDRCWSDIGAQLRRA